MMVWQQRAPEAESDMLRPRITRPRKGKAGYTLLELLIVVAIISTVVILAGGNLRTTEQELLQERDVAREVVSQ